jgi:PAS domain S-box-containing protein
MKDPVEKRIVALFLVVLAMLSGITIVSLRNIQRSTTSSDLVNQTHAFISETDAVFSSLNAGEAALWGYLLTGDERDLGACRRAYAAATEHLEVAKALTRAGTEQHGELLQLEPLVTARMEGALAATNTRKQKGAADPQQLTALTSGGLLEIQRRLERVKEREQTLVRDRDKESYLHAQNTRWIVFTGGGIHLVVLGVLYYLIRNTLAARRLAAANLTLANRQLDATVRERTAELVLANEALVQENLEQRWSNQALDHQVRYHQLILNSIEDMVFIVSKASNIVRINPAVTKRTGFESQELVGGPLQKVLLPPPAVAGTEPPTRHERIVAALKAGQDLLDSPGMVQAKDGRISRANFNLYPLRDRDKIVGGVLTIRATHPAPPAPAG